MKTHFTIKSWSVCLTILLGSVAIGNFVFTTDAMAGPKVCPSDDTACEMDVMNNDRDHVVPGSNIDSVPVGNAKPNDTDGFSLSVDGEVISGSGALADVQSSSDSQGTETDIQVKFDGLDVRPILNVFTVPPKKSYEPGETIQFQASLNYSPWIVRAEVIIKQFEGARSGELARVPVDEDGVATWVAPDDFTSKLSYALRVYDSEGRYDETLAQPLKPAVFTQIDSEDGPENQPQTASESNEDHTALRNIPVKGGAVTIYGRDIVEGGEVYAFGERVPVDHDGRFLIQRILPPGDHAVAVEVRNAGSGNLDFTRQINIPENEWFYVGLADLTLGKRFANSDMKKTYPGEYKGIYNKGRFAFYLKGKIKGSVLLTAALDTGEHDIRNILKRIDEKDPRSFLKRIDPDDHYPIYGDESTTIEDAPTSGHFYVKLQKDDSHVMWGNYKAYISGNKLLTNERALYGGQAVYKSSRVQLDGSRSTEVSLHGAQPGTLVQHDILRGTGGSAYFLKHQDISTGTESVAIEVRDPVTGFVLSTSSLKAGTDYELDYAQGVLLLSSPVSASSGGKYNYVVISYEFTPSSLDVKGNVAGARVHKWMGDHLRIGLTAMRDYSGEANLDMAGADVRLQATEKTYLDLHAAQSQGKGFGYSASSDGGLTFDDVVPTAGSRKRARAWGFEANADLEELSNSRMKGDLQAQYSRKQGGFTTLTSQTTENREDVRIATRVEMTEKSDLHLEGTQSKSGDKVDRDVKIFIEHQISDQTSVEIFTRDSLKSGTASVNSQVGHRIDGGGRIKRQIDDDTSVYAFGQVTVTKNKTRRRDDRVGVGGTTMLSDKVSLEAEASIGTEGLGGSAIINYAPKAETKYYLGYELDPYRDLDSSFSSSLQGQDLGHFISGGRQRIGEKVSVFVEDSYDLFGLKRTLAQNYGMDFSPTEDWTFGADAEFGHVWDKTISGTDFDRKSLSLSGAYRNADGNKARLKAEARRDSSEDPKKGDLDAFLLEATVDWSANENWRLLANLDAVLTDASVSTRDGDYIEGSIGFAYRPVVDDRLNALFKYTYLYDLPGTDQVTVDGTINGDYQVSHIISADAIYELTDTFSIGAKYGMRYGETRDRTPGSPWENSMAHLAILRGDMKFHENWDLMLEARMLWVPTADSNQFGALAAIYRHMGESFKVGVGYNFGRFSDDLADLTADDHGVFINMIGKF
jgi:hypothetical protein